MRIHGNLAISRQLLPVLALVLTMMTISLSYAQEIPSEAAIALAWSPDGTRVAASNFAGLTQIVTIGSPDEALSLDGHQGYAFRFAWSSDGNKIATAGLDETVRLWDAMTGQPLLTIDVTDQGESATALVWSPDSQSILVGASGINLSPRLRLFSTESGQVIAETDVGAIGAAMWSEQNAQIAVATTSEIVILDTNLNTIAVLDQVSEEAHQPNSIQWLRDGGQLAVGYVNGDLWIWDIATQQVAQRLDASQVTEYPSDAPAVLDVGIGSNGELLSVNADGRVWHWSLSTSSATVDEVSVGTPFAADFSPYSVRLATAGIPTNQAIAGVDNQVSIMAGAVQIVVPAPSPERLQSIAALCGAESTVEQSLSADITAADYADVIAQVEALPADTLPPGCAADLLAMAQALASR